MADPCINISEPFRVIATGQVPGPDSGYIQGMLVSASASGTLTLVDGKGKVICSVMPLTAGQTPIFFGARFVGGLTATIGGTADVTLCIAG